MNDDLVITDDSGRTFRPLLACGHFGPSYPVPHPVWDADVTVPVHCPTCNDARYLDATLIRQLLELIDTHVREFMADWKRRGLL